MSTERLVLPADPRVSQWGVIRAEWVKFWSLRSTWYSLALTMIVMIGLGCVFAYGAVNTYTTIKSVHPAQVVGYDASGIVMRGYLLVQLVVGVLGVLVVSGEYGTGMIRSSLTSTPKRLPVLWAKLIVFAVVVFAVTTVSAFLTYAVAQPILGSVGIGYALSAPGVLRGLFGVGIYVTGIGLFGMGLGWVLRHTAGAIATLFALVLLLPTVANLLPSNWQPHVVPYLLGVLGSQLVLPNGDPSGLTPVGAFITLCAWLAVAITLGAVLLRRRDA
ncbi:MAG TPA: ABC transporter permease subunit [Pseudonocardiaceae bacterium]|jgi:ABC-type transport system involved in multi-copper enzyme maturation permease subunit